MIATLQVLSVAAAAAAAVDIDRDIKDVWLFIIVIVLCDCLFLAFLVCHGTNQEINGTNHSSVQCSL